MSELLVLLRKHHERAATRLAAARAELSAAQQEFSEVQRALRAAELRPPAGDATERGRGPTLQQAVKSVLDAAVEPLRADQILTEVEAYLGRHVDRSSLAPQLSRLARADEIQRLDHGLYSAVKREEV